MFKYLIKLKLIKTLNLSNVEYYNHLLKIHHGFETEKSINYYYIQFITFEKVMLSSNLKKYTKISI